ncbi:uncharacterized protein B0H64DRAFT_429985 [Chaetomium fimeti]|uniref:F-box domain-containing protein n=1 Tax=Chaetomium fimeti TaxID=1854472 RepID=A0AAE0HLU1_9PEZI|nr:hypothetical protein B0H64DRAFT_429985 [Chaetomium fimeti]
MKLNDLTALVLTNSALYNFVVPYIYSHFDIAWLESMSAVPGRRGIYSLICGLSTICMGSSFVRSVSESHRRNNRQLPRFPNRNYGQYIKTFNIKNAREQLLREYLVYVNGGQMLGTLVASAIRNMENLESFCWDMPTGVLTSVFEALASLAHQPGKECKLSRVKVRWHDNAKRNYGRRFPDPYAGADSMTVVPNGTRLTLVGLMLPPNHYHPPPPAPVRYSEYGCGYPTFSVLPPLKSLAVLDIDEIGYLDEMAVLIGRSKDTLQELSVGISSKALNMAFVYAFDWSVLTSLTLLSCGRLDNLWKILRKHFRPTQVGTTFGFSSGPKPFVDVGRQYHLALKVIHTDTATPSLINFIERTLAPNSLEGLFLRYRPGNVNNLVLSLDKIFGGAIKPHHASLRKLFLQAHRIDWALPTNMALYLTSGRMKNLRELSVTLKYRDWHIFLRRLPHIPQLRALHIHKVRAYPATNIGRLSELELATQIVDVVSLRPEIPLRYVAVDASCFEILEGPPSSIPGSSADEATEWTSDVWASVADSLESSDSEEEDDEYGGGSLRPEELAKSDSESGVVLGVDDGWEAAYEQEVEVGVHEGYEEASGEEDEDEEDEENEEEEEEGGDGYGSGDEDDGFVEPGSERVNFELRRVGFPCDEVDIFRVMSGKL